MARSVEVLTSSTMKKETGGTSHARGAALPSANDSAPSTSAAASKQKEAPPSKEHAEAIKASFQSAVDAANAPKQPREAVSKSAKSVAAALIEDLKGGALDVKQSMQTVVTAVKNPQTSPINLTLDQLLTRIFFLFLIGAVLCVKFLSPSWIALAVSSILGVGLGLGLSYLYYANVCEKAELNQVMSLNLGIKGTQFLVGSLPTWVTYSEVEKMEWVNQIMVEVWPFVDKGVCKFVKEFTEPIFDQAIKMLGVPIKKVRFKQLTFGDAPFRVEGITARESNDLGSKGLEVDMRVRWCGDANITLAIQLIGEGTEMCPQVADIAFEGLIRVKVAPLIANKAPGFAAAMLTLIKPPRYKYYLNFGTALGGAYVASVVKPFINFVVNSVILNMLVWPKRLVVPVLPLDKLGPEVQMAVARMNCYHKGLLKVELLDGFDIKAMDFSGLSDPYVKMWTDDKYECKSKTARKTLKPVWNQTFYMLVQEPESQALKLECWDWDLISGSDLIGRSLIKLQPVVEISRLPKPDNQLTQSYHLGEGEFESSTGPGKGRGQINLRMTYRAFEDIPLQDTSNAEKGIVIVRIQKASQLCLSKEKISIYCKVSINEKEFVTPVVTQKGSEEFVFTYNNVMEFFDVSDHDIIKIVVFEKTLTANDTLGSFERGVSDVAQDTSVSPMTGKVDAGLSSDDFKLEDNVYGKLNCSMRFVPTS